MSRSEEIIELTNHYGAHNYVPLPIVISEAEGVWVKVWQQFSFLHSRSVVPSVLLLMQCSRKFVGCQSGAL